MSKKLTAQQTATLVGAITEEPARAVGNRIHFDLKQEFKASGLMYNLMLWHHVIDPDQVTGVRVEKVPHMKTDDSYGEPFQDGFNDHIKFTSRKKARFDIEFSAETGLSIAINKIDAKKLLDTVTQVFYDYKFLTKLLGKNEQTNALVEALHKARHMAPLDARDALDEKLVSAFRKDAKDAARAIHKTAEDAGLSEAIGQGPARYILTKVSGLAP
jgi:hypothetical protein